VPHRPEVAQLDVSEDLLRSAVGDEVVILDEMTAGPQGTSVSSSSKAGARLLDHDVAASGERVHSRPTSGPAYSPNGRRTKPGFHTSWRQPPLSRARGRKWRQVDAWQGLHAGEVAPARYDRGSMDAVFTS
jgi:hypothetical protein